MKKKLKSEKNYKKPAINDHRIDTNGVNLDFTGNPITIHFIVRGVNNVIRNSNLKALKYKLRK